MDYAGSMHTTRALCLSLFPLAVSGCPNPNNTADASVPADLAMPADLATSADLAHSSAQIAACEQTLLSTWSAHPPALGLGTASSVSSYDAIVRKILSDFGVPGGGVALVSDGKLVLARSYGFADKDAPQPTNPDDRFRIASLSKQITSAMILKLVEAGSLSLDDSPFSILSNIQPLPGKTMNPKLSQITIRNLLQHTGGWNRGQTFDPMFISPTVAAALNEAGPASCADVIRYMLDKPLQYDPGTTYCYSNFGYCVLGRVIEQKTGMSYADAVNATVLSPLGASRIVLGKTLLQDRQPNEVLYYEDPSVGLATSVFPSMPGQVPWPYGGWAIEAMDSHGGWIASPIDFLRFQVGVDDRAPPADILSQQSFTDLMTDPHVPSCNNDGTTTPDNPNYWYGFGWQFNSAGNWWHTGSLDGTTTEQVRAKGHYGWAIFLNYRPADSTNLTTRVDNDLWTALQNAGALLNDDLFDQWSSFDVWRDPQTFAAQVKAQGTSGLYPSRIEGQLLNGATQYHAEMVPLHKSAQEAHGWGMDCLDYTAQDAQYTGQGYSPISLQWFRDSAGVRRFQAVWEKL